MSSLPTSLWFVFGAAALAALAIGLRNRLSRSAPHTHDGYGAVEYVAAVVGVIYAVVLGLAVVAVWESLSVASGQVAEEASNIRELYLLADAFDTADRTHIHDLARTYVVEVREHEWPLMQKEGEVSPQAWHDLDALRTAFTSLEPKGPVQTAVYDQGLDRLHDIYDARHMRELAVTDGMPPLMWAGLIVGGAVTVSIALLLGIDKGTRSLFMLVALVLLVGFQLNLIYELNHPFSHSVSVSPQPFHDAIEQFKESASSGH